MACKAQTQLEAVRGPYISGNNNAVLLLDNARYMIFYFFVHWLNHCLGKVTTWQRCILWLKSFDETQESRFFNSVERQTIHTNHFSNWPMKLFCSRMIKQMAVLWRTLLSVSVVITESRILTLTFLEFFIQFQEHLVLLAVFCEMFLEVSVHEVAIIKNIFTVTQRSNKLN